MVPDRESVFKNRSYNCQIEIAGNEGLWHALVVLGSKSLSCLNQDRLNVWLPREVFSIVQMDA